MGHPLLTKNPQLPVPPPGSYMDSIFLSERANLIQSIQSRYNQVLEQLGYANDAGQYVQGYAEIDADRQRQDLRRQEMDTIRGVTGNAQREGRIFAGSRVTDEQSALAPIRGAMGGVETGLARQLSDLYAQATGLLNDFNAQQNSLISSAIQRTGGALTENPTGPTPGEGGGGGDPGGQPDAPTGGTTPEGYEDWNRELPYESGMIKALGQYYELGNPAQNKKFLQQIADLNKRLASQGIGHRWMSEQLGQPIGEDFATSIPAAKKYLQYVDLMRNTLHQQVITATKKKGFDWQMFKATPLFKRWKAYGGT